MGHRMDGRRDRNPSAAQSVSQTVTLEPGHYLVDSVAQRMSTSVCLTLCRYEANLRFPRHAHRNPGFFYLLAGDHLERNQRGEGIQRTCSLMYHESESPHETETGPKGMVGLNIAFDREWLECMDVATIPEHDGWVLEKPLAKRLALSILIQLSLGDQQKIESSGLELLALMAACRGSQEHRPPRWLRGVRTRIEGDFSQPLSLTDLAREVAVHPVYLARAFRKAYGCTVTDYLQQVRIFEAVSRISSGMTIGEAAAECGFCDQAYLARVAKAKFGSHLSALNWFRLSKS